MKAINNYVVVDKIKEEPKKIAGLIITDNVDTENRYTRATVISVGDKVIGLAKGDVVRYDKFAGHSINWNDKVYSVIKNADVVIVE